MILSNYNKLNITFCGMMGSGKSVVGRKLAKLIKFDFLDTDKLIEKKTGKSINQIFTEFGETYFRELEENFISKALFQKNYVISLGGGVMSNTNLRKIIKKNSFNIYLYVDNDILLKRLSSSNKRPLIKNTDVKKKLDELYKKRKFFYNKADLRINNLNDIEDTINKLKEKLKINE